MAAPIKARSSSATLSREQALPIGNAVQAFHTIRRLGIMLTDKADDEEAVALVLSIRDIAEKHGAALDECLGKMSPDSSLGVFEEVQEDVDGARS